MEDAFVLERVTRYDIKGRKYIDSPFKYYFEDLGLRNARLGFRQVEPTHMMENMLYNELRAIGMKVDVGQVFTEVKIEDGSRQRKTLEIDFVCNRGYERVYIQSAYAMETEEKRDQELTSLRKLRDGFRRIVIVNGLQPTYMNEEGVYIINLMDFCATRRNTWRREYKHHNIYTEVIKYPDILERAKLRNQIFLDKLDH